MHSVAALVKLYSEQVESIDYGPVEAITATGASTLQILRYGAEWVLEVEIQWDNTDEFGFGFSITPRGLFDPRLRARSLRNEPRFVDFQQRVIR